MTDLPDRPTTADPAAPVGTTDAARARIVHQEVVKLVVLVGVACVTFFATRALAGYNRALGLRDAAEWFERGGCQLESGNVTGAIDAFRRATVKSPYNTRYSLELARALAIGHQNEPARNVLLALRESTPENRDVNLQLARLAADGQEVEEAVRYYHNTLYAPWPAGEEDTRRRVRIELIRLLLAHVEVNRAVSELVALSADVPEETASHVELGTLFAQAGDNAHALDQFQHALELAPDNHEALVGAGLAAFRLGNYMLARKRLQAVSDPGEARATRELVDVILSNDPLEVRIGAAARRARLARNLSFAERRLDNCLTTRSEPRPESDLELRKELTTFVRQLKRPVLEADTVESGVDLTARIATRMASLCPPATTLDRALSLIGQRHGVGQR